MFNYDDRFDSCIAQLKLENRYRVFRELSRNNATGPVATLHNAGEKRQVTIWCGNDYLGMGQHPVVIDAMHRTLDELGAGAGGTRNISGTHRIVVELEHELADLHDKESALMFTSGYVANDTALSTIAAALPNCIVFSDSENHASMIEGIRHSKAEKKIFRHNSAEHLEQLLAQEPLSRPKLVAFESVYSMDGDFGKLRELLAVARKYGAMTYVDETHAVGLYGNRGGGVTQHLGLLDEVDVLQGGLGKGFGVLGGFITAGTRIIDLVRSYGSGFIFTTAIPPVVAAGAVASIRHLKESKIERQELHARVRSLRAALRERNLPIAITDTHIIPFMVGDSSLCTQMSDALLSEYDIYLQPINYPTVPRGTERLRITASPLHSDAMADKLVNALTELSQRFELQAAA